MNYITPKVLEELNSKEYKICYTYSGTIPKTVSD